MIRGFLLYAVKPPSCFLFIYRRTTGVSAHIHKGDSPLLEEQCENERDRQCLIHCLKINGIVCHGDCPPPPFLSRARAPKRTTPLRSPTRPLSPAAGWTLHQPCGAAPSSLSPLGSGHGSSASGKRRFFGLSESAEAEAEAAANSTASSTAAESAGGGRGLRRREVEVEGLGKEGIDAHRMVVSLRSDPMRAMLRSGESGHFAK